MALGFCDYINTDFFSQILFDYYMCIFLSLGRMKVRVRHHVIYCVQEQEYLQKAVC